MIDIKQYKWFFLLPLTGAVKVSHFSVLLRLHDCEALNLISMESQVSNVAANVDSHYPQHFLPLCLSVCVCVVVCVMCLT